MSAVGGIELHYYLQGGAHSMDAVIKNRCEAELLAIFQEVASTLGVPCEIQAQALSEGGIKEVWKWVGENAAQLNVVLPVVAILIALAPQVFESEQETLSKELTELSIEEKKLQIKKLRKELEDSATGSSEAVVNSAVEVLRREPKVVIRRSNFYKQLVGRPAVESIGITPLNSELTPLRPERKIPQTSFSQFVISSHVIRPLIVENAKIEIVSPVLREGNFRWKGIYDGKTFGFVMQDSAFQGQVLRKEVTFQNGSYLEAILSIHRELDELGDVKITKHVVVTVIKKYDEQQALETKQGRAHKEAKKLSDDQQDLFKNIKP